MEKKLPVLLSAAALAAGILALALTLVVLLRPAGPDPAEAYRMEKRDEIADMVLQRQVVPEDYLRYLDEPLAEEVRAYNEATANLHQHYAQMAGNIVNSLFYAFDDAGELDENGQLRGPEAYQQPEHYYDWVGRIAHWAMYANTEALCSADPALCFTLGREAGGSYGMWPASFHQEGIADEDTRSWGEEYQALVDALLDRLDAARSGEESD